MDTNPGLHDLTPRETEIARLIADGDTNAEIAERLGISFWTAKWHVSEIISKLGVDSREEVAAAWTREHSVRGRLRRARVAMVGGFSMKPLSTVVVGSLLTFVAGGFVAFAFAGGGGGDAKSIFAREDPSSPPQLQVAATSTPTPTTVPLVPGQYVVQAGDSCPSIAAAHGITLGMLLARNPWIDASCTNLVVGQTIDTLLLPPATPDSSNFIRLADLDGVPAKGHMSGFVDPDKGLYIRLVNEKGQETTSSSGQSSFRDWELYIAGGGTADGVGGDLAVVGSERVAQIDLVVDGAPPESYTPVTVPAALGYPLRVLYVTLPPGKIWEFVAYDDAGNHIGTVAHGSSLGAGESYVDKTAPGGPTPTPSGPRLDAIDANSNGHVLRLWPEDGAQVTQAETAPAGDPLVRNGVCAEIAEEARGPAISIENVEFWVDQQDVSGRLTRYIDIDPATAASGTLCFAPEGGLAPGPHYATMMLHSSADRQSGMLGRISWQFEVVADPATPTPATN